MYRRRPGGLQIFSQVHLHQSLDHRPSLLQCSLDLRVQILHLRTCLTLLL
ncbi:hypothetical protein [Rubritalea tangerina]